MKPMQLGDIAAAADGALVGDPDLVVTGVATSTADVVAGSMFVAIPGERVDGHDFAEHAVESGAVAVLAQRPVSVSHVLVPDSVSALGGVAKAALRELDDTAVVAVTGSSGKTTTKDLMATVFAERGSVVAPQGSFNNEIGMPMTVLSAGEDTRTLVLEMGARGIGHISYLCGIAPPDVSVVLNIGSAHVGEFGGQENTAKAKSEIYAALAPGGTAIVNVDDHFVADMGVPKGVRRLTFGMADTADLRITDLDMDDQARPRFTLTYGGESQSIALKLSGEHNAHNAAAAAAAGLALGMDLAAVARGLNRAESRSRWRMEVTKTASGVTIVNDAYNANPESMTAALKSLVQMQRAGDGRSWAVVGEMLELGADSLSAHDAVGRMAVRLDVSRLIAVGPGAKPVHMGASQEGSWGEESVWVPDTTAALEILRSEIEPGDIVLVKASRAVGLETVAAELMTEGIPQ